MEVKDSECSTSPADAAPSETQITRVVLGGEEDQSALEKLPCLQASPASMTTSLTTTGVLFVVSDSLGCGSRSCGIIMVIDLRDPEINVHTPRTGIDMGALTSSHYRILHRKTSYIFLLLFRAIKPIDGPML